MNRIKVVNEPVDLVPILLAVDTEVKRAVLKEISQDWKTEKEIEKKYGQEGLEALKFFEKMKLVDTKWQSSEAEPEKAFHAFYTSFHINASSPINEMSDVLAAAVMPEERYVEIENRILEEVGDEGKFAGDIAQELDLSQTLLRGLIKRSSKLEFKGQRIEKAE